MEERVTYRGLSISSCLTLIFIVLKLVGVIDWSWWLVCLPTIIAVGLWLLVFMLVLVVAFVAAVKDYF